MTRHGPFHYSGSPRDRIRRPHRYYCRAKTPCCHPNALRCLRTSVPSAFLFSLSYLLQIPERGATLQARVLRAAPDGLPCQYFTMEQRGPPRFLGSPSLAFALLKRPRPRPPAMPLRQSGVAPADQTTKAATILSISRLIHTASAFAVYASKLRFPYTGKTRFRRVANPYRVGLEPTGLLWRISSRLASLSIPTPQA